MKLLQCNVCGDVIAIRRRNRHCMCGDSWGKYLADEHIVYGGDARVLDIPDINVFIMPENPSVRKEVKT